MPQLKVQVWIGVDPASHRNGFAWRIGEDGIKAGMIDGIRNIGNADLLADLESALANLNPEIFLCVEFPTWTGGGTREVRTAAMQWIAELKDRFPRKVRVHKVDPNVWQPAMLTGVRGSCPQERYLQMAEILVGYPIASEDAAAAVCLMEYGRRIHKVGGFGQPPKRAKRIANADRIKRLGRKA